MNDALKVFIDKKTEVAARLTEGDPSATEELEKIDDEIYLLNSLIEDSLYFMNEASEIMIELQDIEDNPIIKPNDRELRQFTEDH